jgi:GDP-4-dehydro-6-deoxy-D-mannose reductase
LKKTLLVFGVSGFAGTHLGRYLEKNVAEEDLYVIGVVSRENEPLFVGIHHMEVVDASDGFAVHELLRRIRPDFIVNFIGLFRASSFQEFIRVNVEISNNILQAVVDTNALETRLLFIGSAAEYGAVTANPVSEQDFTMPVRLYGLSKVFQTHLVSFYYQAHRVQSVVARTFNLTGEGISASLSVGNFQIQIDAAQDGDMIKVGNLDSERDFLEVETAVALYMDLLYHGKAGEVYNVCSGRPTRIGDLLADMIARSGKTLVLKVSPQLLRGNDISRIYGSRAKLEELLSWICEDRSHV